MEQTIETEITRLINKLETIKDNIHQYSEPTETEQRIINDINEIKAKMEFDKPQQPAAAPPPLPGLPAPPAQTQSAPPQGAAGASLLDAVRGGTKLRKTEGPRAPKPKQLTFLDEIKKKQQLRHVEHAPKPKKEEPADTGIAAILSRRMAIAAESDSDASDDDWGMLNISGFLSL